MIATVYSGDALRDFGTLYVKALYVRSGEDISVRKWEEYMGEEEVLRQIDLINKKIAEWESWGLKVVSLTVLQAEGEYKEITAVIEFSEGSDLILYKRMRETGRWGAKALLSDSDEAFDNLECRQEFELMGCMVPKLIINEMY